MPPTDLRRALFAVLALASLPGALAAPAAAAPRLVEIGRFTSPVHVASPPGDPRLFVVEQAGTVRVLDAAGTLLPAPFLDLTSETLAGGERGLLSIAFAPDYAGSGLFYVYLTADSPAGRIEIREYRRSPTDPNRAEPAQARTLLAQDHPASNHNGGGMLFGPDGKLWIGLGDGGGSNDPDANGQNRSTLLGKLLRLDPRGPTLIPADNPFLAPTDSGRDEIWAYGLRNPWRFSFDRQTGDLVIGDVGQNRTEEVDFAAGAAGRLPAANYGWRCFEGTTPTPGVTPCVAEGHVPPVHELDHVADGACSITGGQVVRDPGLPTLVGRYVYADLCLDRLRSLVLADGRASGDRAEPDLAVTQTVSFAEDACGRSLVVQHGGAISRLVDGEPTSCSATGPPGGGSPPPGPGGARRDACSLIAKIPRSRTRSTVVRLGLRVGVQTFARCAVTASATIAGVGTLRTPARTLVAGERASLRLKGSTAVRRALTRRLASRRSVLATVRVTAQAEGSAARSKSGTVRIGR